MKSYIKNPVYKVLEIININRVVFGKNKGLKLRYSRDLNLDMIFGLHEPNTFEVFDIFIKPGMVVADIGANVGYFSKFLSKKVGGKGEVHAFEPIPLTFDKLTDTVNMNNLNNLTLVNKAVSDSNSDVTMYLSHTHYMASLDRNWATDKGGATSVPATTLDSYFESLGRYPDFIKMDIEGGGVFALKGMKNCIIKNEPVLLLESHTPAEDFAIGQALSLAPYDVYRVGSSEPVKYLDRNFQDINGIYGTVIGIPKSK
ncbi:MAG TPA: FkbM family methyltransferase, partial [Chitinophagaceae bacterium]